MNPIDFKIIIKVDKKIDNLRKIRNIEKKMRGNYTIRYDDYIIKLKILLIFHILSRNSITFRGYRFISSALRKLSSITYLNLNLM